MLCRVRCLHQVAALSTVFIGSVVLGNVSLRYIPVSFNQAIGATTPLFTAVFAVFIAQRRESIWTYLTLIPVMVGIIIASRFEPQFHLVGFTACISATGARALKSVWQGVLLSNDQYVASVTPSLVFCCWS